MNEWLCKVQLFPKVWILEISIKAFRMSGSVSGSRFKGVFGYLYPVANSISCRISNRQTGWWSSLMCSVLQRWADCEIFQSESSPDPMILNPIQCWSAKFLKIIGPKQSWSTNVKSCFIFPRFILPHEANELLKLFCLKPNTISWRQNSSISAFASWGKIDTAFWHFQNLIRKCLFSIRGKSTSGVILPLWESDYFYWSSDKEDTLALA